MSSKMVFTLEGSVTNVANKPSFDCMLYNVLLDEVSLRKCHLTFRAAIQNGSIKCSFLSNFSRLLDIKFLSKGNYFLFQFGFTFGLGLRSFGGFFFLGFFSGLACLTDFLRSFLTLVGTKLFPIGTIVGLFILMPFPF